MSLRWFRIIAILEGISFLVLLGIAMPLKYWAGSPGMVQVVGAAHGALFVAYLALLAIVSFIYKWSFLRAIGGVLAAFLPFGTFVFDWRIRRS